MPARNEEGKEGETKDELGDDVDALFRLPLAEFTGERNTLAARLKKGGRGDEAKRVKALVKPSISAWAVNQLYWRHREPFDRLLATGQRFREAQTSRFAGKVVDTEAPLAARREALSDLSRLATALLLDAGYNPTLDTMRRITTTLEAMSAYSSRPDAPPPGRLTHDVDPPGFESLASLIPASGWPEPIEESARVPPTPKSGSAASNTGQEAAAADGRRQLEEIRQARIASAKASLQDARRALTKARARSKSAEAAQKKAQADAKEAEKQRRDAEERFEKASAASEAAGQRARTFESEVEEAAKAVKDAERTIEKASNELESLSPGLPAR